MYTILIVDDEYPARQLMRMLVDTLPDYTVVGEAEDGQQALALYQRLWPNVVLTDIEMPVMNGLELIEAIKAMNPAQPIIILSCYESFSYAQRAMRSGVRDYLIKDMTRREDIERCLNEAIGNVPATPLDAPEQALRSDTFDRIRRISAFESQAIEASLERLFSGFFRHEPDECLSEIKRLYHYNVSGMLQYRFLQFINGTIIEWIGRETESLGFAPDAVFGGTDPVTTIEGCSSPADMCRLVCAWLSEWMRLSDAHRLLSDRTREIIGYIVEHYAEDLTLENVAEHFYIHPVHLSRTIKNETGITFSATVNRIRIEKAKLLLALGNRKISDIAYDVGFGSPQGFYSAFKKQTGISPADYARSIS